MSDDAEKRRIKAEYRNLGHEVNGKRSSYISMSITKLYSLAYFLSFCVSYVLYCRIVLGMGVIYMHIVGTLIRWQKKIYWS